MEAERQYSHYTLTVTLVTIFVQAAVDQHWQILVGRRKRRANATDDPGLAGGFIKKNAARPFLLYFPMALVHNPFKPTPAQSSKTVYWIEGVHPAGLKY